MNTPNFSNQSMANNSANLTADALYAQLYHTTLPEWKGEYGFYRKLAREMKTLGPILEIACGTGRISIDLALQGLKVTGFDLSKEMLEIARKDSVGIRNLRWEQADMRAFELGERYALVMIPGHSFQFMLTPADQIACLTCIRKHLMPGGRLVVHIDHQNLGWLWNLYQGGSGTFERVREVLHPASGNPVVVLQAWSYEPSTQTASIRTVWEERDSHGKTIQHWERGPCALHCIFRFEMEHLLSRAGFTVRDLYGDFERAPFQDNSSEMIWVSE